jgi:hypothetical protein
MADSWRGSGDGRIKFGPKARAWLERVMRSDLEENSWGLDRCEVEPLVRLLLEQYGYERYVYWSDYTEYRGKGWACGCWTFFVEQLRSDTHGPVLWELRNGAAKAADAERITSLDDWLRADAAGTLQFKGEQGGTGELSRVLKTKLRLARERRYKKLPRLCPKCRAEFVPNRTNTLKCESCRGITRRHSTGSSLRKSL